MAFITGFGGTLTFTGVTGVGSPAVIPVRSFTLNVERASLDVTLLSDYREKRLPGRIRRSGTITILRQTSTADATLQAHLFPASVADATGAAATLGLKYVDQGSISYDEWGAGTGNMNVHITSCTLNDDGTNMAVYELTWEEQ